MTQNEIQERAVQSFIDNNYRGYLNYSVGIGKTKIAVDVVNHIANTVTNPIILIGIQC